MIEKIEKCYVCDQWFDVKALRQIKVSSQGGDVEKGVCKGCMDAVEERSWGEEREGPCKNPK